MFICLSPDWHFSWGLLHPCYSSTLAEAVGAPQETEFWVPYGFPGTGLSNLKEGKSVLGRCLGIQWRLKICLLGFRNLTVSLPVIHTSPLCTILVTFYC